MPNGAGSGEGARDESRVSGLWGTPGMENMHFDSILAKKLNMFVPLTTLELRWLAEIQAAPQKVKRGKQITQQGQVGHRAYVLQAGWACSYKDLPNGTRQIISFPIPGDCVGLRSVLLQTADHSFTALTDAVVTPVEGGHILECVSEYPRLGAAILWATSRDEAMIVEHLVSIGRRSAIERTAHFFIELAERLSFVGLASGTEFECPLTQFVLADALGLTAVHINRVLRQLRELDLLTLHKGSVRIHDLDRLRKLAGFEGGFLNSRDQLVALPMGRR
jgi:CRP-like cAMP-binding protein